MKPTWTLVFIGAVDGYYTGAHSGWFDYQPWVFAISFTLTLQLMSWLVTTASDRWRNRKAHIA